MLTNLAKLFDGIAALPQGLPDLYVTGVASDSRMVRPGDLFVALPGSKANGISFIEEAKRRGAVAVLAETAESALGLPVVPVPNARFALALLAAKIHPAQPETIVAVTGTNGKTSVAVFVRQIWEAMGFRAASLGTIGVVGPGGAQYLQHTTPDPLELHALVSQLREDHVKHLAVEASSHGLAQHRLDGLKLTAGGFTNLTHDHLDYHSNADNYFKAKLRLFEDLLPQGAGAVVNADSDHGEKVLQVAVRRKLVCFGVGVRGNDIRLLENRSEGLEQHIRVRTARNSYALTLPLAGDFQVSNALVAAGLVIASGGEEQLVFHALQSLKGAPGRLEHVGKTETGASVFVDYAHTPDALENAIKSLRPFANGRIITVFGCGGDRDKKKRPIMGEIASRLSDRVIVTDDNPRTETAATIRKEILSAALSAEEIGDRALAIRHGVEMLQAGDILLVAGKGHEPGQTVGVTVLPFSDHDAVKAALKGESYHG